MSAPDPHYNVTKNANTDGAALTNCSWCGAVVVDTERHSQWHHSLTDEITRALRRSAAASRAS